MKKNIIGGDLNTVLNLDKFGGIKGTHQNVEIRLLQV